MRTENGQFLRVRWIAVDADVVLRVVTVWRQPDGRLISGAVTTPESAALTAANFLVPLSEGDLAGVEVSDSAGLAFSGAIAVSLDVMTGGGSAADKVISLTAGWPSGPTPLAWGDSRTGEVQLVPLGQLTVIGDDAAAGAEFLIDLELFEVARLCGVKGTFEASATVATRNAGIHVRGGGAGIWESRQTVTTAAGGTTLYQWTKSGQALTVAAGSGSASLPEIGGSRNFSVVSDTIDIEADDQWSEVEAVFEGRLALP